MPRGKWVDYDKLGLGYNLRDHPLALSPGQTQDGPNCVYSEANAVQKRSGTRRFNDAYTSNANSLFAAEFPGTINPTVLLVFGGQRVWSIDTTGTEEDVTQLPGLYTADQKWDVEIMQGVTQGPLWATNGSDVPQTWDGTPGTDFVDWNVFQGAGPAIPSPFRPKYLKAWQNKMMMAGFPTNPATTPETGPSMILATRPLDPQYVDPSDEDGGATQEFRSGDGDEITGMGVQGNSLIVFKNRSCFKVYDPATLAYTTIDESVGCVSHRSIAETPQGLVFLSQEGLMITDGQTVRTISDNIRPYFYDETVELYRHNAAAVYHKNKYQIAMTDPGGVTNNVIWQADMRTLKGQETVIAKHEIPAVQLAVWKRANADELYAASPTEQKTWRIFDEASQVDDWDGTTDAEGVQIGDAIEMVWTTAQIHNGKSRTKTRVHEVAPQAIGEIQLEWGMGFFSGMTDPRTLDFSEPAEIWASADGDFADLEAYWAGGVVVGKKKIFELGTANAWQFRFTHSRKDETAEIYALSMDISDDDY